MQCNDIGHVVFKYLLFVRINSVNLLYLIMDQINGYINQRNRKNIWR